MTADWIYILIGLAWLAFLPNVYLFVRGYPFLGKTASVSAVPPSLFVIQITTVGKSPDVVDGILDAVRGYRLPFSAELWVVAEEADPHPYRSDRTVRVPRSYRCHGGTLYKARALEYARGVRVSEGIETSRTRILFLDDDSLPSREYVVAAYWLDADIAHGSITIQRAVGGSRLAHVADHYRTADCVGTCPRYCRTGAVKIVHGEGLTVHGGVEFAIGWDFGQGRVGNKAEDLLFGRRAVVAGFRYAYIPERLYITSPLTIGALFQQRRRWMWNILSSWGDLDRGHRWFVAGRMASGYVGLMAAFFTVYVPLARITFPLPLAIATGLTTAVFFGFYGFGAWRNTRRGWEVVKALVLAWPATFLEAGILVVAMLRPPRGFHVVAKALPAGMVAVPTVAAAPPHGSAGAPGGVAWQR